MLPEHRMKTGLTVILLWALLSQHALIHVRCTGWFRTRGCEFIRIPMCKGMPYNMTRMPNLLHHSTQDNAILAVEQFQELVQQNCSDVLLFFLCAMYAPICTLEFQSEPIPPCKGVCERARAGCEPLMNKYNVTWPESLNCKELPVYDRGVCVSPEAIVTTLPEDERPTFTVDGRYGGPGGNNVPINPAECSCNKRRLTRNLFRRSKFKYGIKGRPVSILSISNRAIVKVRVTSVYFSGRVRIRPGMFVELKSNTSCMCPKVTLNREYIVLGHEDRFRRSLLYLPHTTAVRWKVKWESRVKKWTKRYLRKRGRRNRRGRKHRKGRKRKRNKKKQGQNLGKTDKPTNGSKAGNPGATSRKKVARAKKGKKKRRQESILSVVLTS